MPKLRWDFFRLVPNANELFSSAKTDHRQFEFRRKIKEQRKQRQTTAQKATDEKKGREI